MFLLIPIEQNSDNYFLIDKTFSIGRGKDNDYIINDSTVSTYHAKIHYKNEDIYIEDLHSTNGTYLDGIKLEPLSFYQLYDGQTLQFGEAIYKIKEKKQQQVSTGERKEYFIGRDPESDLFIDEPTVSFRHLKVYLEDGAWYIEDLNSTNGTYLDNFRNSIKKAKLEPNRFLYLSTYKISTNEILELVSNRVKSNKQELNNDITIIGRNPEADVHIDNINVSWEHAKIKRDGNRYFIYDLNSTNGTFVNGIEVSKNGVEIQSNDRISLGIYTFIFKEDKQNNFSVLNINRKGFKVTLDNLSFKIKNGNKVLLDNVELTIYPGEMVGIMGLSGAGKTTLLKTISGYTKPTQGRVLYNNIDLYSNFERIKNSIGYVPQEDILYPELTVYEALYYSLNLRLKEKLSKDEIDSRIDKILIDLGLDLSLKSETIGSADEKVISGGQKKRLNIAMELLADPEIIFLDEPTSGLSSVDAKIVIEKLKDLSNKGKTVILTIHQPSLTNYKLMDNIAILSKGKLSFYGPSHPDSISFFNNNSEDIEILNDPDMALIGLHNGEKKGIEWKDIYLESDYYKKFVKDRANKELKGGSFDKDATPSALKQFSTLISRYFKIKIKDRLNSAILLLQAPVIAFLLAFLFTGEGESYNSNHPSVLLFILSISSVWFGLINSVKEIVSEKAILERESVIGLRLHSYILSKFLVLATISLIQVIMLVGIVTLFGLIDTKIFLPLTLLVYLTALAGVSIGLFISAIAKSVSQALSLVPLVLLPMIIFGGGMIPIKDMKTSAYGVSLAMPTRWSLEQELRIFDNNSSLEAYVENGKKKYKDEDKVDEYLQQGHSVSCKDKMCIEVLYMKQKNSKWSSRASTSSVIYTILSMFVILPLLLVLAILYRRLKK